MRHWRQRHRAGVRAASLTAKLSRLVRSSGTYLLILNGLFLYIFFLTPLVVLVVFSFNEASRITPPMRGFTFDWYRKAFEDSLLLKSVRNSVSVALAAAVLTTALTTLAAYSLYRHQRRFRRFVEVFTYLPLITPALIYSVALLIYFHNLGLSPSLVTVVVGHVTVTVPFAFIIITYVGLVNLDPALEEASLDLGASRFTTFRRVIFPVIQPAVLAAFLFSAMISFNELILAFFLGGTENTLPIFVWSQFQRRITPEINAISSIMIVATLVLILLIAVILKLQRRTRSILEPR